MPSRRDEKRKKNTDDGTDESDVCLKLVLQSHYLLLICHSLFCGFLFFTLSDLYTECVVCTIHGPSAASFC